MNLSRFYNSPKIVPSLSPDDPSTGKDRDHYVPVCAPHTDRYNPPSRTFKTVKYRPLPESSLRKFGEWIVQEGWGGMKKNLPPSKQVEIFEKIILDKLDIFCTEKTIKVSSQDKQWINAELKTIHRQKSR